MKTKPNEKLEQAVSEVEAALEAMLKSEAEAMKAKVEKCGDMTPAKKYEADAEPAAMDKDEASMSAPPDSSPAPEASASPEASPEQPQDPAMQEQPASVEELTQAYCELSPDELAMHEQALMAAKAKCAAPADQASPGPTPPGAAAPAPGEDSAPMAPGSQMDLGKSEEMKKDFEDLQKSVQLLTQAVTTMIKAPQRKAVVGADMAPGKANVAVESLSKSEINSKLDQAARRDISKQDRALITRFYNNQAKVSDVAHLLQ